MAVLAVTLLLPIWWGAEGQFAWDNSIAPSEVLRAMARRFAPDFFFTYGPVPYYLFAGAYVLVLVPLKLTGELGQPSTQYPWGFDHPELSMAALVVAAHLVTFALAMTLAVLAARRERDQGYSWLAPIALLGSPVFAFYARTSNVDLHYLFWGWLAVHLAETGRSLARLCWAVVAAVVAICTKEQVAPIAITVIVFALARAWRLPGREEGGLRAVGALLLAAAATYVAVWRLPYALESWLIHHAFILGPARYARDFPATFAGMAALYGRSLQMLPSVLGFPILAGVALALLLRVSWAGLGLRTCACFAYAIGFLATIGYVYERFLLPFLLLAVPLAVRGYRAAFEAWAQHPLRVRALGAAAVALALAGGPLLSWVMLNDPRYEMERWIRAHLTADAVVEIGGNPHYQARVPRRLKVVRVDADSLRDRPRGPVGDLVLTSSIDRYAFEREPEAQRRWLAVLEDRSAAGAYSRIVFPRGIGARLFPALEIPDIVAYVRRGGSKMRGRPPGS